MDRQWKVVCVHMRMNSIRLPSGRSFAHSMILSQLISESWYIILLYPIPRAIFTQCTLSLPLSAVLIVYVCVRMSLRLMFNMQVSSLIIITTFVTRFLLHFIVHFKVQSFTCNTFTHAPSSRHTVTEYRHFSSYGPVCL